MTTLDKKIIRAEELIDKILFHSQTLLRIHYSNRKLLYSDIISSQIPKSFAAHTFNLLQITQYRFEVMRLSALWDSPSKHRESIPTLLELLKDNDVKDELQRRYAEQWERMSDSILSTNEEINSSELEAIKQSINESKRKFGLSEAIKARRRLELAINAANSLLISDKLKAIIDFRHTKLAHNLDLSASTVDQELKTKYGDERYVLDRTLNIVSCLNLAIRGASFEWRSARKIAERYAKAFWDGAKFDVIE